MRAIRVMLLLAVFSSLALAQIQADDVKTFTLKNGMEFLVLEDHSIPHASFYIFWKVGSRNEVPGITGLSHFFEHMMFNGSRNYGPGEFDRVMEAAGGSNNAYTSENLTVYTDWFPSEALETIFQLESDRIGWLSIDPDVTESERGVIHSEWSTGLENSNFRNLYEQVKLTAIQAHPYRWSVIGYESDILNWTKEDLEKYHRTYYAPNNGLVVIVGDVTLEQVKTLAEKYIEPIPAQDPPRKVHTVEPKQRGEKRIEVHKQVNLPNLMIAYHVPETASPDNKALDLLDAILTNGRTSRLYKSLVDEKRLALNIFGLLDTSFDPFIYGFYSIASAGVSTDDIEKEIYSILDDIAANGVTEQELQKVKNQKKMDFYRSMTTNAGRANTIGTVHLFYGDYKKLFNVVAEYESVTSDDIKAVAAKYFDKSNRTVGVLRNLEAEGGEK